MLVSFPGQTFGGLPDDAFEEPVGEAPPEEPATDRPLDDDVEFTVYRPGRVAPERPSRLLVLAHLGEPRPDTPDPQALVAARAAEVLGEEQVAQYEVTSGVPAARPIPRDELVTVTPIVDGCDFEPAQASLKWQGPVHHLDFRFTVRGAEVGTRLQGAVRVEYEGAILLAEIPLVMRVGEADDTLEPTPAVRPYRRIFPSYSRKDSAVIELFRRYARAFGDEYMQDVLSLRAGEDWRTALRGLIERADVFQLFWSSASAASTEVRMELGYALALDRPNFVRPVFWEVPPPTFPDELRSVHFARIALPGSEFAEAPPPPPKDTGAEDGPTGHVAPVVDDATLAGGLRPVDKGDVAPQPSQAPPPRPSADLPRSEAPLGAAPEPEASAPRSGSILGRLVLLGLLAVIVAIGVAWYLGLLDVEALLQAG
ncbi:MAG: toll/interleukin-1 receptor domain-containing protein [Myxococcota bacterium]